MPNDIQLPSANLALAYQEAGKDNFQAHLILLHPGSPPCQSQGQEPKIGPDGKPMYNKEGSPIMVPLPPKGVPGDYFANDVDFGPTVDVLLVDSRYHAFLKIGGKKTEESFDLSSATYKEIKNTSQDGQKVQPRYGIAHLLYLAKQKLFLVYHPNTKTARKAGYEILMYGTPINDRPNEVEKTLPHSRITRLSATFQKDAPNPFYKPQVTPLPMDTFKDLEEPSQEEIDKQVKLFRDPIGREPRVTTSEGPER